MNWTKILSATTAILLLAGCQKPHPNRMTQQIVQEGVQPQSSTVESAGQPSVSMPSQSLPQGSSPTSKNLEELRQQYAQIKAQKDAIEIDIENLETSYRIGKLAEADFLAQKKQLLTEKQELDAKKGPLEYEIKMHRAQIDVPTQDPEEMMKQRLNIEVELDLLEVQEGEAERSYQMGKITREEFIQQRTAQIVQEEQLEDQEEALEMALELLGFDD